MNGITLIMSKLVNIAGYVISNNEKTKIQVLLHENFIEVYDFQNTQIAKCLKNELKISFLGSGGGIALISIDELKIEIYEVYKLKRWLDPKNKFIEIHWGIGNLVFLLFQFLIIASLIFWIWKTEKWVDIAIKFVPQKIESEIGQKIQSQLQHQLSYEDCHIALKNTLANLLSEKELNSTQFFILDQSEPNAFAIPGQMMFFNLGLFNVATAEEFIAIAAHEFGHITYRHSLKSMTKILGTGFMLSLFTQDLNSVLILSTQQLSEIIRLSYSRALETEADVFAQQRLDLKKMPNSGLISFFEKLKNTEYSQLQKLSFLSTHPSHNERIKYLTEHLRQDKSPNQKLQSDYSQLKTCLGIQKRKI